MKPSEAIAKLLSAGLTEAAIGEAVGARQSTINKIKRGDMVPNWELGKRLIDLAESLPDEGSAAAAAPLKDAA